MKAFVRKLFFVTLCLFIAPPLWASSFDIAGDWDITFKPRKDIELNGEKLLFPTMTVKFTISEITNDNIVNNFLVQSEAISELNDISFSTEGLLSGDVLRMPGTDGSPTIHSSLVAQDGKQDLLLDLRSFRFTSEDGLRGDIYVLDSTGLNLGGRLCGVGNRSAVPVPSAAWLLGSGVIALFVRRRSTNA